MDILTEKVMLAKLCKASGFTASTAKSHLHKGYLIAGKEGIEGGADTGMKRRFSFFTVMQAAVAKEMIDLGLVTSRAFEIARAFAHEGEELRHPALPYHYSFGDTFLAADAETQEVVLRRKGEPFEREYPIMVDVWPIYDRVARTFCGDPYQELNDAYNIHSGKDLARYGVKRAN